MGRLRQKMLKQSPEGGRISDQLTHCSRWEKQTCAASDVEERYGEQENLLRIGGSDLDYSVTLAQSSLSWGDSAGEEVGDESSLCREDCFREGGGAWRK